MRFEIPFIKPVLPSGEELAEDFAGIVASNWYSNFGPVEQRFRSAIADYVGSGFHAATVANATAGLMAALSVLLNDSAPGGYVIVPSFTFAAGPEAIRWIGKRPLFIDIEADTLQPSLESARHAVAQHGDRIVGILLCNTFGIGNARVHEWEEFARAQGIPLLVDSAAGFGSLYPDGARLGSAGDCEVFSFHATKPFAIGEGGAVLTRDAGLAERIREFTNFGFRAGVAEAVGLNAKLQELNAAIGLRQLERFDGALAARRSVLARLQPRLTAAGLLSPPHIEESSVCFTTVLAPSAQVRDTVLAELDACGVEAKTYYSPAAHLHPALSDREAGLELPVTLDVISRVISLPSYEHMTDEQIETILGAVERVA